MGHCGLYCPQDSNIFSKKLDKAKSLRYTVGVWILTADGGLLMISELLTVSQTAKYLQLSEKTVRRLINEGKLSASKVANRSWRIRATDVEDYIQAHTNGKKESNDE
jgi:excisionase family DNA binding protein